MKRNPIEIICIGKIKNDYWLDAFSHYQKMLNKWRRINLTELRDASGDLSPETRKKQESEKILANLPPGCFHIALHEKGKLFTSMEFSELLHKLEERHMRKLCFILGGPFGLSPQILSACHMLLSLSPMTFPHEMARVLLVEQLYRAHAILAKLPYHH